MSHLFVGNFDFERTLAERGTARSDPSLQRLVAELSPVWVAVAENDDVLWCPESIDLAFFEELHQQGLPRVCPVWQIGDIPRHLNLIPWGWTDNVVQWAHSVRAVAHSPPLDSVRAVNSRRFSHRLEQDRGCGLHGAAVAESLSGVFEAIERLSPGGTGWVVKAEFSNSSRERFLHRGNRPFDRESLARWAVRRLAMGQALFVEPWAERVDEVGVQVEIPQTGVPRFEGLTRLLVDDAGRYRGSEFTPSLDFDPEWEDAVSAALEVGHAIQQAGYFGPLGIDAMRYRDATGNVRLRPLQDVNARWTMGRLSLGLRRLLHPGERGYWLHGPCAASARQPGMHGLKNGPDVPVHLPGGWDSHVGPCESAKPGSIVREIVTSPKRIGARSPHLSSIIRISTGPGDTGNAF